MIDVNALRNQARGLIAESERMIDTGGAGPIYAHSIKDRKSMLRRAAELNKQAAEAEVGSFGERTGISKSASNGPDLASMTEVVQRQSKDYLDPYLLDEISNAALRVENEGKGLPPNFHLFTEEQKVQYWHDPNRGYSRADNPYRQGTNSQSGKERGGFLWFLRKK